ncbi:glycyl-tRNA synthetase [Dichomitus squalens]|uniref:glycine--tRNA ligase n=1 Tax=Dichomitus squalens TaxID=114155 RepID=A0A4Q9PUU3_9APHY|nr:glycyl-tRNA synthetase [Dichomitus squalens]
MLEVDTTVMTPAPVFETSGHVARFADWMVKDLKTGEVLRADHLVGNVLEARLAGDKEARGLAAQPAKEDDKKKKKKDKAKAAPVKLSDEQVVEYETILAQLDNYSGPELGALCKKHNITNPDTGNEVSEPQQFNLMFASSIGPTGQHPGFLRPETAQGHFLNFSRLLEFNNGRVPFASAQIGRSFRNEISPRAGLLRVREFTMAEIEHFVDPEDKRHERFADVRAVALDLLDRDTQAAGSTRVTRMTIGDAVDKGVVANETLGYFLARIHQFLLKIGIDPARLRFRQHMANEMAHYATDCWDAEIQNSYGWTECVGCADRAAYDLSVHSAKTGHPLVVRQALKEPIVTEKLVAEFNKRTFGQTFGKDSAVIQTLVGGLDEALLAKLQGELAQGSTTVTSSDGREFKLTPDLLTIEKKTFKQSIREFTPNVIEPSFGLGRILYVLLEHSFWSREQDVERGVLSLPAVVAPTKVLIVPLSAKTEFDPLVREVCKCILARYLAGSPAPSFVPHGACSSYLSQCSLRAPSFPATKLRKAGVFSRVDDSNTSIGKRYARNDELGTPYGLTLDFACTSLSYSRLRHLLAAASSCLRRSHVPAVQNRTMTLRERDTTGQLIGSIDEVIDTVIELVNGSIDWAGACRRLPAYDGVQAVE